MTEIILRYAHTKNATIHQRHTTPQTLHLPRHWIDSHASFAENKIKGNDTSNDPLFTLSLCYALSMYLLSLSRLAGKADTCWSALVVKGRLQKNKCHHHHQRRWRRAEYTEAADTDLNTEFHSEITDKKNLK